MKSKNKISISESFIFRARCRYCGTKPTSRVYEVSPAHGKTVEEYQLSLSKKPYYISGNFISFFGKLVKSVGHYVGGFSPIYFNKEKNISGHKMICCKCGITWWFFNSKFPRKSTIEIK